jgi:hypothetical protein
MDVDFSSGTGSDAPFKKNDKIRLLQMLNDPNPIPIGMTGIVQDCRFISLDEGFWQVSVKWDNGSTLMLSVPPDKAELI